MGRSSTSSRKKKRSKKSSQAGAKKRSKIRSKKSESKKLRRRCSYDDDDNDSVSSMSGSDYSSSSEDTKRRSKKSRVRTKKHVVKKKRSRQTYSSESSEEDSPRARKKKSGSKRKRDYGSKSKSSKKRRKRDDSFSYKSSESLSRSTPEGDSISRKHGKEERDERNLNKVESEFERSRYRQYSPMCYERSEDIEYQTEERVSVVNNSRRLRSVIVSVTEREKEDRESIQNEGKEVMHVHDDHDYPSSRSNDSNDSGSERDEQEKKTGLEIEKADATVISDLTTPKNINSGNVSDSGVGDLEKTSEVSGAVVGANSDALESVLRQRALENLRRFRGAVTKKSSTSNNDLVQDRPVVEDGTELLCSSSSKVVVSTETQSAKDTNDSESVPTKQNIDCPINQTTISACDGSIDKVTESVSAAKPKLARPVFARQLSETNSSPKMEASEEPVPLAELLGTKILNTDDNGADTNVTGISTASEPSSVKPVSGEASSDKPRDDAGEGSQFEKKTMSVMRGGEMVQVKYKVYIPKNAPALARRKLKR